MKPRRRFDLDMIFPSVGRQRILDAWNSGDCHIETGSLSRFKRLLKIPELSDFERVVEACDGARKIAFTTAPRRHRSAAFGNDLVAVAGVSSDNARRLYEAGFAIQFDETERFVPDIARLRSTLALDVGHPVELLRVRVICSSPGAGKSYGWHFDRFDNVVVQVRGSKQWSLRRNDTVRFPLLEDPYFEGVDWKPGELRNVQLDAGDALFSPRGFWHSTGPVDATEGSLSLAFEFLPLPWMRVFLDALVTRLMPRDHWRQSALHVLAPYALPESAQKDAADLLRDLGDVVRGMSARDILDMFEEARAEGTEIESLGLRAPLGRASGKTSRHRERVFEIDPEVGLTVRFDDETAQMYLDIQTDNSVSSLGIPFELEHACNWLVHRPTGEPFALRTLHAACSALTRASIEGFVEALAREGVVRPSAAASSDRDDTRASESRRGSARLGTVGPKPSTRRSRH